MSSSIARNTLAFVFGFLVFMLVGGAVYYYKKGIDEKDLLQPLPIQEVIPPIDDTPSLELSSTTNSTTTTAGEIPTSTPTSTTSTTQ